MEVRTEGHKGHRQGKGLPCRQRDCQKAGLKGGDDMKMFGEQTREQCNNST